MKFTIATHLPEGVHGVKYVKNHHYIELIDSEGRVIKINATGIILYLCIECDEHFFMLSNKANGCPVCGEHGQVKNVWLKPQLAFIPEQPSDFRGGFAGTEVEIDEVQVVTPPNSDSENGDS